MDPADLELSLGFRPVPAAGGHQFRAARSAELAARADAARRQRPAVADAAARAADVHGWADLARQGLAAKLGRPIPARAIR